MKITIEEATEYVLAKEFLHKNSDDKTFIDKMELYLDCRIAMPTRYNRALIKLFSEQ